MKYSAGPARVDKGKRILVEAGEARKWEKNMLLDMDFDLLEERKGRLVTGGMERV